MKILYTFLIASLILSTSSKAQQEKRGALNLTGAGGIIEVPHHNNLNLGSGAFTIEAWIQASSTTTAIAPIIICKKQDGMNANGWMLGMADDGKLAVELKGNGYKLSGFGGPGPGVTAIDLRDDQCHHVAITREIGVGADTLRGYQDGQYIKKSRKTVNKVNLDADDDVTMGGSYFVPPSQYQFDGMIKEIRVWSTTRTQSQIDDNKTKWLKGNESGLIAYWRINESEDNSSTRTTVREYVGMKQGTVKGATMWDQFCNEMDPLVGISTITQKDNGEFVIYPNPASQLINISGNTADVFEASIFDMSGRNILNQSLTGEKRIDISNLNSGTYLLLLNSNDGSIYRTALYVK